MPGRGPDLESLSRMVAMLPFKPLLLVLACTLLAASAPAPAGRAPGPPLAAGEALALAGLDREVFQFGETQQDSPMGNLAYLPWLRLEGAEWSARNPRFKCEGVMNQEACSVAKGHGKVNLPKAIEEGCDLAILSWARLSAMGWRQDYGEGASRARLEEAFSPFLGGRMPPGDGIPVLDGAWVGDGVLLRTSPAAMLSWLMDPSQEQLLRAMRRLLINPVKEAYVASAFWVLVATAQVPMQPGVYSAWAVGSNDHGVAVLRLPPGTSRAQALARFQAIMLPKGNPDRKARP